MLAEEEQDCEDKGKTRANGSISIWAGTEWWIFHFLSWPLSLPRPPAFRMVYCVSI